jgi:hypothetical protein
VCSFSTTSISPSVRFSWSSRESALIAVLVSALPHLILLIPALAAKSAFVRWHGRQALLLAGVQTVVPLVFGLAFGDTALEYLFSVLLLVWLFGTLLGQQQAARGDCSLARWAGRADVLPAPEPTGKPVQATGPDPVALIDIIRYSQNPQERSMALSELEKMGRVEPL